MYASWGVLSRKRCLKGGLRGRKGVSSEWKEDERRSDEGDGVNGVDRCDGCDEQIRCGVGRVCCVMEVMSGKISNIHGHDAAT